MAKGTCGESATRKNRSASRSTTRSGKRPRATNDNANANRNNATAKRAGAYLRGMSAFKKISRGNLVSKIDVAIAKKALALGQRHAKKVDAGKQLTPGQQKELDLYMEALSESPNIQEELELVLRKS